MIELSLNTRRGSFELEVASKLASQWTVVFGPSGAGKSTLLRLLAGLDQNSATGRVQVIFNGNSLTDTERQIWLHPGQRKTAFVVQQSALFPHLNVEANIAFGLHGFDKVIRQQRIDEMLDLVDARDLRRRRVHDLSGGQSQRIALARALATHPQLLLLDEPFSALDGVASDALLVRLHNWAHEHHVQVVLATHDVADALAIAAEVLLLHEGRQMALGPANEVLAAERTRLLNRLEPA